MHPCTPCDLSSQEVVSDTMVMLRGQRKLDFVDDVVVCSSNDGIERMQSRAASLQSISSRLQHWPVTTVPCCRSGCPCTSTYNGAPGEHCCISCYRGKPCTGNYHRVPSKPDLALAPPVVQRWHRWQHEFGPETLMADMSGSSSGSTPEPLPMTQPFGMAFNAAQLCASDTDQQTLLVPPVVSIGEARPHVSFNDVHLALLGEWSSLCVDVSAFEFARSLIHGFLNGEDDLGCIHSAWDGLPVLPTGDLASSLFVVLCSDGRSPGIHLGSIELAHGFCNAVANLTSSHTIDALSSEESTSDSDLGASESHQAWSQRVSRKHSGAGSTLTNDNMHVGGSLTPRSRRPPEFYTPSPSGFARDCVSTGEMFAARDDSQLSDAAISSDSSSGSSMFDMSYSEMAMHLDNGVADLAEVVAIVVLDPSRRVLGGTECGPLFVPSTVIVENETAMDAARRLLALLEITALRVFHPMPVRNIRLESWSLGNYGCEADDGSATVVRVYQVEVPSSFGDQNILRMACIAREVLSSIGALWPCPGEAYLGWSTSELLEADNGPLVRVIRPLMPDHADNVPSILHTSHDGGLLNHGGSRVGHQHFH